MKILNDLKGVIVAMKILRGIQSFLGGKKTYLAAAAAFVPAAVNIVNAFSAGGVSSIPTILHSPDWAIVAGTAAMVFQRMATQKVQNKLGASNQEPNKPIA